MKKLFIIVVMLCFMFIPRVNANADEDIKSFDRISFTTIHNPSSIGMLLESTANESFRHTQTILGENEIEYIEVDIPETGWFGFATKYYSDTDTAGGRSGYQLAGI